MYACDGAEGSVSGEYIDSAEGLGGRVGPSETSSSSLSSEEEERDNSDLKRRGPSFETGVGGTSASSVNVGYNGTPNMTFRHCESLSPASLPPINLFLSVGSLGPSSSHFRTTIHSCTSVTNKSAEVIR
jgi:hypothetical protein